jgi:hypothetical protein
LTDFIKSAISKAKMNKKLNSRLATSTLGLALILAAVSPSQVLAAASSTNWKTLADAQAALGSPNGQGNSTDPYLVYNVLSTDLNVSDRILVNTVGYEKTFVPSGSMIRAGAPVTIRLNQAVAAETVDSANWKTLDDAIAALGKGTAINGKYYATPPYTFDSYIIHYPLTKNLIVSDRILVNMVGWTDQNFVPAGQVIKAGTWVTVKMNPLTTAPTVDVSTLTTLEAIKQIAKDGAVNNFGDYLRTSAYLIITTANINVNASWPLSIWEKGDRTLGQIIPTGRPVSIYINKPTPAYTVAVRVPTEGTVYFKSEVDGMIKLTEITSRVPVGLIELKGAFGSGTDLQSIVISGKETINTQKFTSNQEVDWTTGNGGIYLNVAQWNAAMTKRGF